MLLGFDSGYRMFYHVLLLCDVQSEVGGGGEVRVVGGGELGAVGRKQEKAIFVK